MSEIKQTETYQKWEARLKDPTARAVIAARIFRLAHSLLEDVCPVGESISELRIDYGPGYRVYFQKRRREIILLLCGGSKKKQDEDIKTAKKLAKILEDPNES